MSTKRSAIEVKARCKLVLGNPKLIKMIQQSSSPSAAHVVILSETGDEEIAKAGRWLAILRRDYFEEYEKAVS